MDGSPWLAGRGKRRGLLVAALTLSIALPTMSTPAQAAPPGGGMDRLRQSAQALALPSTSPIAARPRTLVNPACTSYELRDGARDTRSRVDVVSYALDFDCTSKQWELRLTTASGFRVDQIGYLAIALDVDLDPRNNCGGVDVQAVVYWEAEIQRLLTGVIRYQGSCRTGRVSAIQQFQHAAGSKQASLRFGSSSFLTNQPERFNWFAFVSSNPDATGSWWDSLPNRGYHEARPSDLGPIKRLSTRTPGTRAEFTSVATGDFFGDGPDDIFGYRRSGVDSFFRTVEVGSFIDFSISGLGLARQVVAADFDGNGYDDLLFYEPGAGADSIRWNERSRSVTTPVALSGAYQLAAGDFDGDGIDDIAVHRPGTASDRVWFGTSARTFEVVPVAMDDEGRPLAGDFDGDGRHDLLFWQPERKSTTVLRGRADRTFDQSAGRMGGAYRFAAAGDFNGDLRDDVVFTDGGAGRDALWNGKASSPWFVSGGPIVLNERITQLVAADFTGDGGDDLWIDLPGANLGYVFSSRKHSVPKLPPIATVHVEPGEPFTIQMPNPGGYGPYRWFLFSGTNDVLIDPATGLIAGTLNGAGSSYSFTVEVQDRYERPSSRQFTIEVADLPSQPLPFSGFGDMITDRVEGHVIVTAGAGNDDLVLLDDDGVVTRHVEGLPGADVLTLDGDRAYVSLRGSHLVLALDRATLALVAAYDLGVGREASSLAVSAGRLWFGYDTNQSFGSVDLVTSEVKIYDIPFEQVPALTSPAVYVDEHTPDQRIYLHGTVGFCNLVLLDVSAADPVVVSSQPLDVALLMPYCGELVRQASGPTIAATGNRVVTLDAALQSRTVLPFPAWTVDYAPVNGGWVVLTNSAQLMMYRPGGSFLRFNVGTTGGIADGVLSPSGTRALAVSSRAGEASRVLVAVTPD